MRNTLQRHHVSLSRVTCHLILTVPALHWSMTLNTGFWLADNWHRSDPKCHLPSERITGTISRLPHLILGQNVDVLLVISSWYRPLICRGKPLILAPFSRTPGQITSSCIPAISALVIPGKMRVTLIYMLQQIVWHKRRGPRWNKLSGSEVCFNSETGFCGHAKILMGE